MKVVFTEEALQNIDEILAYTSNHYPAAYGALVVRLPSVIARVAEWPDSAQEVKERPGVRVVPLVRYPTRSFTGRRTRPSKSFTSITLRETNRVDDCLLYPLCDGTELSCSVRYLRVSTRSAAPRLRL